MFNSSYDGTRKKVHWQEMWRHELLAALENRPVVIVPTGSIEQHGPHCPMAVDITIPFHIAVAAAEAIDDFPVIVAPPIWSGFTHFNMGEVGTIDLRLNTFLSLVGDVCRSLKANGFERMVVMNGHGGNVAPLRTLSVDLARENVWALAFPYWDLVQDELKEWSETDNGSIGHGGEWETSLLLYLHPEIVDQSRITTNEWPRPGGFSPEIKRVAWWPERRREAPLGIMGNPTVASAEKGKRLFHAAVNRLVKLVREYHEQPVRHYFEFGSHCP